MPRHRIIRALCLTLILLCVAAWKYSYIQGYLIVYTCSSGNWIRWETHLGSIRVATGRPAYASWTEGWYFLNGNGGTLASHRRTPRTSSDQSFYFMDFHLYWGWYSKELGIPYWFIAIVLSLTTLIVWRKTRPTPPWQEFPVEVDPPTS